MGFPDEWVEVHHGVEMVRAKTCPEERSGVDVSIVREDDRKTGTASSRLQQAIGCRDLLPEVPRECGPKGRLQKENKKPEMQNMQPGVSTASEQSKHCDLQTSRMPHSYGQNVSEKEVGQPQQSEDMQCLSKDIHPNKAKKENLQKSVRLCVGVEKSKGISRADCLRALGNGVVPDQVAEALRILFGRLAQ